MKSATIISLSLFLLFNCTRLSPTYTSKTKQDVPNKSKNYYGNTYQYSYNPNEPSTEPNSIKPGVSTNETSETLPSVVQLEDTSIKVVNPSLIEKYRRARNTVVYVDLYPVDWDAINKDRGIKKPKEKKQRQRRPSYFTQRNSFRPGFSGIGLWPMIGFGWNAQNGWSPTIGINAGPRGGFGPNTYLGWNGNNGLNYGMGFGNTFGIPFYNGFNNSGYYNNGLYNGGFYNQNYNGNRYRTNRQQNAQNMYNQGFIDALYYAEQNKSSVPSTTQSPNPSNPPTDTTAASKTTGIGKMQTTTTKISNTAGYEDGIGGPDRYQRNVKTIEYYKIK